MSSTDPVRQHFVPRGYLSSWACGVGAQPGWVWRFDRELTRVDLKSPRKILREAHIYTTRAPDGTHDYRFERFLQEREDAFYTVRQKLLAHEMLDTPEWVDLLAFTAAARVRTQINRDRHRAQWGQVVKIGEEMMSKLSEMSPDARSQFAKMQPASGKSNGLTLDQARKLRDEPIQTTLVPAIKKLVERFDRMEAAVLFAQGSARFITSDNPCVFYDANARARPPLRAFPDIASPTFEVSMPLSPIACLRLGPKRTGHYAVSDDNVVAINNRTAAAAARFLVATTREGWPPHCGPADWRLGVD
ncbi:DUF4238 domain-containing protein [Variovorax sp. HJSM1_2]|uniref:DUF4238 domain-containing protein n=1 Tax=Variovorax sp. HJSM1_2 TaxID=3366263 RepID=UPI003BCD3DB4